MPFLLFLYYLICLVIIIGVIIHTYLTEGTIFPAFLLSLFLLIPMTFGRMVAEAFLPVTTQEIVIPKEKVQFVIHGDKSSVFVDDYQLQDNKFLIEKIRDMNSLGQLNYKVIEYNKPWAFFDRSKWVDVEIYNEDDLVVKGQITVIDAFNYRH